MFELVDSMGAGKYFWESLENLRRPPCDLMSSGVSATLLNERKGVALILAPATDVDDADERCLYVQLRDLGDQEVLLDVTLDANLHYLKGQAMGIHADELAASETLAMYGPDLLAAQWEIVESGEAVMEEEHV